MCSPYIRWAPKRTHFSRSSHFFNYGYGYRPHKTTSTLSVTLGPVRCAAVRPKLTSHKHTCLNCYTFLIDAVTFNPLNLLGSMTTEDGSGTIGWVLATQVSCLGIYGLYAVAADADETTLKESLPFVFCTLLGVCLQTCIVRQVEASQHPTRFRSRSSQACLCLVVFQQLGLGMLLLTQYLNEAAEKEKIEEAKYMNADAMAFFVYMGCYSIVAFISLGLLHEGHFRAWALWAHVLGFGALMLWASRPHRVSCLAVTLGLFASLVGLMLTAIISHMLHKSPDDVENEDVVLQDVEHPSYLLPV